MAEIPVDVVYNGTTYTIVCTDTDTFEVFQMQVFSLTDVPPEKQTFEGFGNNFQSSASMKSIGVRAGMKVTLREGVTPPPSARPAAAPIDAALQAGITLWQRECSRIYMADFKLPQPQFTLKSQLGRKLCMGCANTCHVPTDIVIAPVRVDFVCECGPTCLFADRVAFGAEHLPAGSGYRELMLGDMTAVVKQISARQAQALAGNTQQFEGRMQASLRGTLMYEDSMLQEKARRCMPEDIHTFRSQNPEDAEGLATRLLAWFKGSFFTWMNSPKCNVCEGDTQGQGSAGPSPTEQQFGAGVVELYKCNKCQVITRFPRYNHPGKLLETRTGRCGEWANCFTLCCRAVGLEARYISDWTDHVWTEIYVPALKKWCHADSCENRFDAPLLYEAGWNKKLNYVIAFARDEVVDVTRRYTKKWDEVQMRRTIVPEQWLQECIGRLDTEVRQRRPCPADRLMALLARRGAELQELASNSTSDAANLPGRESGSQAWRDARGESGASTSTGGGAGADPATCTAPPPLDLKLNPAALTDVAFGYGTMTPLACSEVTLRGHAKYVDGVLRLASPINDQIGAAWHTRRVDTKLPFHAAFTFRISPGGADGMAFVIQAKGPDVIGTGGDGMGYAGIGQSVAVEFDIYESRDRCEDPNGNHISIHTAGTQPNKSSHRYSLGCTQAGLPALADGRPHTADIVYTPPGRRVPSMGEAPSSEGGRMDVWLDGTLVLTVQPINLATVIEAEAAWVGFTAATGGLNASHDVLSWRLNLAATAGASTSGATAAELRDLVIAVTNTAGERAPAALKLLAAYAGNILKNSGAPQYCRIAATNKAFLERLAPVPSGMALFARLGFVLQPAGDAYVYTPSVDGDEALKTAVGLLTRFGPA